MTRDQVENVIDKLDGMGLIRKARVTGSWYQIACPSHSNGQEKRPSCGVLLEDQYKNGQLYPAGMCHCFTCHYSGSIQKWVQDVLNNHGVAGTGVSWLEENIPGFKIDSTQIQSLLPDGMLNSLMDKYAADNLRMRLSTSGQQFVSEEELASYRYTVPYMYNRRLTDEIIDKFDVGFDANYIPPGRSKKLPCITFPVCDAQGRPLFIARRSVEGKFWSYPPNVTKPVYGLSKLPRECKSVVVVESIFNCLTSWIYGYPAVALLGTGNSYQIDQLKKLGTREFVLCLDGDDAGRKASEKLKKSLQGHAIVWTIHMPDGKDLNDCTKEEFLKLYAERE